MQPVRNRRWAVGIVALLLLAGTAAEAGMPALLPTGWTRDNPAYPGHSVSIDLAADARWRAISFFSACLLASAWGVKFLWNRVQRDFSWLPRIGYGRSLSFVILWGLLFVIVLAMISGARELMTPGAWKKQGWTYKLADAPSPSDEEPRRRALERLRQALWQYAATHEGKFPAENDSAIDPHLWEIPGWAGLRYLYVADRTAEDAGRLLVFEPEIDGDERRVLLTNGLLGTMRSAEIELAMTERKSQ